MTWLQSTLESETYYMMISMDVDTSTLEQFSVPLNPVERTINQDYSISGKTFTPNYVHDIKKANYIIKAKYLQTNGKERSLMREFWRLRKRNAKGFYLPSWNKDYNVVSYDSPSKTVTVTDTMNGLWGSDLTRYLLIYPDGDTSSNNHYHTRATSITDTQLVLQVDPSGMGTQSVIMNTYFVHFEDMPMQIKSEGTHAYSTIEFTFREDQGDRST